MYVDHKAEVSENAGKEHMISRFQVEGRESVRCSLFISCTSISTYNCEKNRQERKGSIQQ
jgi:hypothetical protein